MQSSADYKARLYDRQTKIFYLNRYNKFENYSHSIEYILNGINFLVTIERFQGSLWVVCACVIIIQNTISLS